MSSAAAMGDKVCGNMSSAIGPFAVARGLVNCADGTALGDRYSPREEVALAQDEAKERMRFSGWKVDRARAAVTALRR
jgi:hypothetical protein